MTKVIHQVNTDKILREWAYQQLITTWNNYHNHLNDEMGKVEILFSVLQSSYTILYYFFFITAMFLSVKHNFGYRNRNISAPAVPTCWSGCCNRLVLMLILKTTKEGPRSRFKALSGEEVSQTRENKKKTVEPHLRLIQGYLVSTLGTKRRELGKTRPVTTGNTKKRIRRYTTCNNRKQPSWTSQRWDV